MPDFDIEAEWNRSGARYRSTISSGSSSSAWLRDAVLKPEIVRMLGHCGRSRVLDAGTGGGWLFEAVEIGERHACDIAVPEAVREDVEFTRADLANLPYQDDYFDAVVTSIVLCYCENLDTAISELHRVTKPQGRLIVALTHPHFYRTGQALPDDGFVVEADLSAPERIEIMIGDTAGPFTYYRRSIPEYVNALVRAGWRVEEMRDLYIPREEYEARIRATDLVLRSTRVPLFSVLSLKRN